METQSTTKRDEPVILIRRWRWVMMAMILADITLTLVGQPREYWTDPSKVHEGNELFHFIMSKGAAVSILVDVFYLLGAFLFVSKLPVRLGTALMLSLMFGHYFGASSWLYMRFHLGAAGVISYGVLIAVVLTWVGMPSQRPPSGAAN